MPIYTITAGGVAGVVLGMVFATAVTAFVSFYAGKRHQGLMACCGWVLYDPEKAQLGRQNFGGMAAQEGK
jgi:hypothetical protein